MILGPAPRRTVVWMGVAASLILTGLAIDVGFTRPRAEEARSLAARRAELSSELTSLAAQGLTARRVRARMGEGASAEASSAPGSDLAWIAQQIEASGLRRHEIVMRDAVVQGGYLITRYSLRVTGGYHGVLDLVRRLETDRRLVIAESLRLQPAPTHDALEAGLDLALVTPTAAEGGDRP